MPRMSNSTTLAAGAAATNVLAGQLEEFVTQPSAVHAMAAASAVGLLSTFIVGRRAVLTDQQVSYIGTFPIVGQADLFNVGVRSGRLFWTFRNPTAGSITVNWAVDVDPV